MKPSERVNEVFRPASPMTLSQFFFGRRDLIDQIVDALSTPGMQAVVHGPKGFGKTSLAKISVEKHFIDNEPDSDVISIVCRNDMRIEDIVRKVIKHYTPGEIPHKRTIEHGARGQASFDATIFKTELESQTNIADEYLLANPESIDYLLDTLSGKSAIIVIDELASTPKDVRAKIGGLVKSLSDDEMFHNVKLLLVATAEGMPDLFDAHESIERHLSCARIPRMTDEDIQNIAVRGFRHLDLYYEAGFIDEVVRISIGIPWMAHTICKHAALAAIRSKLDGVSLDQLRESIIEGVRKQDRSLSDKYRDASNSGKLRRIKSALPLVLKSAALMDEEFMEKRLQDFMLGNHRAQLKRSMGETRDLSESEIRASITLCLEHLLSSDGGEHLVRRNNELIRFKDPLFRCYCRFESALPNALRPKIQP